jgi:hypothetical protein
MLPRPQALQPSAPHNTPNHPTHRARDARCLCEVGLVLGEQALRGVGKDLDNRVEEGGALAVAQVVAGLAEDVHALAVRLHREVELLRLEEVVPLVAERRAVLDHFVEGELVDAGAGDDVGVEVADGEGAASEDAVVDGDGVVDAVGRGARLHHRPLSEGRAHPRALLEARGRRAESLESEVCRAAEAQLHDDVSGAAGEKEEGEERAGGRVRGRVRGDGAGSVGRRGCS